MLYAVWLAATISFAAYCVTNAQSALAITGLMLGVTYTLAPLAAALWPLHSLGNNPSFLRYGFMLGWIIRIVGVTAINIGMAYIVGQAADKFITATNYVSPTPAVPVSPNLVAGIAIMPVFFMPLILLMPLGAMVWIRLRQLPYFAAMANPRGHGDVANQDITA